MNFELVPTKFFLSQIEGLTDNHKKQIEKKIVLIKQNPFRFKTIHSKQFSKVFRVRLNIEDKETRLIYVVLGSKIILVCLLERSKEYKDMEKYLEKVRV